MSKRAWLTPNSAVVNLVAYSVTLPDNDELRACFYGAFLLLCEARNWQEFGTMTPEEAASLFSECWLLTVPPTGNLEVC